ncbi:MAG TPA: acyltransferase, partial [Verrucomicrobiae bacterium]|nr:acyltransferase [Verrucomicrobiae bacterium]
MAPTNAIPVRENAPPAAPNGVKFDFVPALNGLRGVAILLVLGNHIPLRKYKSLLPGGYVGVNVFFVLSGFLITTLLVQEFNRQGSISLRNFYIRRVLRLGPALISMLAVICTLSFVLFDPVRARQNCTHALIALFYASNWVKALSHDGLGIVAQTWSLSAEEQFYVIWPFFLMTLLRATRRNRHLIIAAAVLALLSWLDGILLALNGATFARIFFGLDSQLFTLMIGCLLGVWLTSGHMTERTKRRLQKLLVILAPLSLISLVVFSIVGNMLGKGLFYYGFSTIALLAAGLILEVMIRPQSILKRFLEMKWLVWLGSISYGLYL